MWNRASIPQQSLKNVNTKLSRSLDRGSAVSKQEKRAQRALKGGESSSQFRWFTIAKIELQFLIFFVLILGLRLQRYSTNTKRCTPEKSFWKL